MKLAVIDHQLNFGGGIRFITNLLVEFGKQGGHEIVFYCNKEKLNDFGICEKLEQNNVKIVQLQSLIKPVEKKHERLRTKVLKAIVSSVSRKKKTPEKVISLQDEIKKFSIDHDLLYFPWPYGIPKIDTDKPKVATFHDFNFKYFWGVPIYDKNARDQMNSNISEWLQDCTPVVSTNFMKAELIKFYPEVENEKIVVAHLPSLNIYQNNIDKVESEAANKYSEIPYIVCPVHLCSHKNISTIITAASIINKEKIKTKFIFTGKNTELLSGRSEYLGVNTDIKEETDIVGLGYISDLEMNNLLKNASAVLNASYYEAGNGIGLDAWAMGIPVIQSDIDAHNEHIDLQGFKAFKFDPKNHNSLVSAILSCLSDEDLKNAYVLQSLTAANNLSWKKTANKYLEAFNNLLN